MIRYSRTVTLPLVVLAIAATTSLVSAAAPTARRATLPNGYIEVDGVAAVVGAQIVRLSELRRAIGRHAASQSVVPTDAERPRSEADLMRQTLETLIDGLLITDAAKGMNLTVSDKEVEETLASQKERNGWSDYDLANAAMKLGFSSLDEYREHVRSEKQRMQILRAKLGSRLRVTEEEVARVVEIEHKGGTIEEAIHGRHVLIQVPPNASPMEVNALREKAWKIYDQLMADRSKFGLIADEVSDDLATTGGDLGWLRRWSLEPTFANKLWSMKPGEISTVIQTPFGFHIVEQLERKMVPVKDREILTQVTRARLTEEQFVRLYRAWVAELRAATHVEIRL